MGFGSYKTAWLMCHKVRAALGNQEFKQLIGYVEVNETYVAGKAKNKQKGPGGRGGMGGRGTISKIAVGGAVQRKGNVIARVIDRAGTPTLDGFVEEVVSHKVSLLSADDNGANRDLNNDYPHGIVRHSDDEYVVGAIHTQTIDGFWSKIKRGIVGAYHKVRKKYLQLYVNEFEFRHNNRENADIFCTAIRGY